MKNKGITLCLFLIVAIAFLCACNSTATAKTTIEMELTENYSSTDPFINAKLFCVSENVDALDLDTSFRMEGESGALEIADNETGEVLWSDSWEGTVAETTFTIPLTDLKKEKEYVIRFTGTKIIYAKIVAATENPYVQEQERPQKSNHN